MDKTAIKNFAVEARNKLIEQVKQKAFQVGITKDEIKTPSEKSSDAIKIGDTYLNQVEIEQRNELISEIEDKDYQQVMEEVAYTWFNRFVALRYMEVNDYLPTGVRVLSSLKGPKADPDIMREALNIDLDIEKEKVYQYQDNNEAEKLYKYLLIEQCNELHQIMPFIFEEINDYTELLLPDNLLAEGSIIDNLVKEIEEEDWREGVEIIGWLYQFYISEKKDEVFASNSKISKEEIPAATQFFTPKWIVKYMVDNSLGRYWLESNANDDLQEKWEYYLEEAEQEPEVKEELEEIRDRDLKPEEIKVLDPACGSGHILVYSFDVLYDIYQSVGYMKRDIPRLILKNNLYGLDIDDRAAQLAYFAVMMKAREKDRRIFRNPVELNICAIEESNSIDKAERKMIEQSDAENISCLLDVFEDARDYGSILDVDEIDSEVINEELEILKDKLGLSYSKIEDRLQDLIKQTKIMEQKYEIVCTNPPYMRSRKMNSNLKKYLKESFNSSKKDLYSVFIKDCKNYCIEKGYIGMVTQHSWMFLSSFEDFRKGLLKKTTINSMVHLGPGAFEEISGEIVQAVAFILNKYDNKRYIGNYIRLVNYNNSEEKKKEYFNKRNKYFSKVIDFTKILGMPVSYWINNNVREIFERGTPLGDLASPKTGMTTGDNDRFLRYWYEVKYDKIGFGFENSSSAEKSNNRWFPYNKGGGYRKWKGLNEYVINWKDDGFEIKNNRTKSGRKKATVRNEDKYFSPCITWSSVSSNFSSRIVGAGYLFDSGGSSIFLNDDFTFYIQAILSTPIAELVLSVTNDTLNNQPGDIAKIPIVFTSNDNLKKDIKNLVEGCIELSQADWNAFETSWDFKKHPLLKHKKDATKIKDAFNNWQQVAEDRFYQLKENEEKLNKIFIDIYGLEDELDPEVPEEDITVRKADRERDIQSFISYAVGCMMGRYSLDEEGLAYAGGEFDESKYQTFEPNEAGIIPICKDEYFDDDIVARFIDFLKVTFGEEHLEENLEFISESLPGRRKNPRERIRKYFITKSRFYKHHLQRYNKRPIYWLFQSDSRGKAFNALMYMHRYDKGTVSKIRVDYLHELQKKLEAEKRRLERTVESDVSSREKGKAKKRINKIEKDLEELKDYDQQLNHIANQQIEIDLDDGVKENYPKFEDILANM